MGNDNSYENLSKRAGQVTNMMHTYMNSFKPPNQINPADYDLASTDDVVRALEDQNRISNSVARNNTFFAWVSIILTIVTVGFGVWNIIQTNQSNALTQKQLDQFERVIQKIPPPASTQPPLGPYRSYKFSLETTFP